MKRNPSPVSASGFTLLEVLIAVAVLGIVAGAAVSAATNSAANLDYLQSRTIAHWVALNRAADIRLQVDQDGDIDRMISSGEEEMAGRLWYWSTASSDTANETIVKLAVMVREDDQSAEPVTTLTMFIHKPDAGKQ